MDKEKALTQFHIAALAYGTQDLAGQLHISECQLINRLEELEDVGLGFRLALRALEIFLHPKAPEQSQVAAAKAIEAITSRPAPRRV